jgi:hypothetical protein
VVYWHINKIKKFYNIDDRIVYPVSRISRSLSIEYTTEWMQTHR